MHRLLILFASLLLWQASSAQPVTWYTNGSSLPRASYSFQTSREGTVYALSNSGVQTILYQLLPSTKAWRRIAAIPASLITRIVSDTFIVSYDRQAIPAISSLSVRTGKALEQTESCTLDGQVIRCLTVDNSNTIYVGTDFNGTLFSKDHGKTWDTIRYEHDVQETIYALAAIGNRLYVTSNYDVVSTTDLGNSWRPVYYGAQATELLVAFKGGLFGIGASGGVLSGIDTLIETGGKVHAPDDKASLNIDSKGALYYTYWGGLKRSTNAGKTWDTLPQSNITGFTCDSSGSAYAATADSCYQIEQFGDKWTEMTAFRDGAFTFFESTGDSLVYARIQKELLYSNDNGAHWHDDTLPGIRSIYGTTLSPADELLAVCRNDSNEVVIGSRLSRTAPWTFSRPTPFQDATFPYRTSGRFSTGEIWTVDAEGFFTVMEPDSTWRTAFVLNVPGTDIVTAAATPNDIVIATGYASIYRSTDKGKTFRSVFDFGDANEIGIAIAVNTNGIFVLTSNDHIFSSTDDGKTWMNFAVPSTELVDLVTDRDKMLYLATSSTVYRNIGSFNWSPAWTNIGSNIEGLNFKHLSMRKKWRLYAITQEGDIYWTDYPSGAVRPAATTEQKLRIIPNPARTDCTLSYSGEAADATITLYNMLGVEILQIPFSNSISLRTLSAGVYHLVVRTPHSEPASQLIIKE